MADDQAEGLLTTGEVATLLRSSRQHVVDMCERGELAFVRVGTHRRIHRHDVDAVFHPPMTRDQVKALWLHRVVASALVANPEVVLDKATTNLDRLERIHPSGMTSYWLKQWRTVFGAGPEAILDMLTSTSAHAIELRQNSPFAGVLGESERSAVLASFRRCWQRAHAA